MGFTWNEITAYVKWCVTHKWRQVVNVPINVICAETPSNYVVGKMCPNLSQSFNRSNSVIKNHTKHTCTWNEITMYVKMVRQQLFW